MCCGFLALVLLGPRFFGGLWWLVQPLRWQEAFNNLFGGDLGGSGRSWVLSSSRGQRSCLSSLLRVASSGGIGCGWASCCSWTLLPTVAASVASGFPIIRGIDLTMIDPQARPAAYIKLLAFVAVLGLISALVTFVSMALVHQGTAVILGTSGQRGWVSDHGGGICYECKTGRRIAKTACRTGSRGA